MTRFLLLLIALISLVSLAAVACGSEDESGEAMPETAAVSPTEAPASETTQATKTQEPAGSTAAPAAATKDAQPSPAQSPATAKVEEQAAVEEPVTAVWIAFARGRERNTVLRRLSASASSRRWESPWSRASSIVRW